MKDLVYSVLCLSRPLCVGVSAWGPLFELALVLLVRCAKAEETDAGTQRACWLVQASAQKKLPISLHKQQYVRPVQPDQMLNGPRSLMERSHFSTNPVVNVQTPDRAADGTFSFLLCFFFKA